MFDLNSESQDMTWNLQYIEFGTQISDGTKHVTVLVKVKQIKFLLCVHNDCEQVP